MKKKIIINGQETNYSVTDDARIFNDLTGKELKGTYATNEYHSVQLVINGKPKTFMFHRLVAEAFCENPNGYTIVDHIDRDKHNDKASNLRWVDSSTNAKNRKTGISRRTNEKYLGNFSEKKWYPVFGHPSYMISEDCEIVNITTKNILIPQDRHGYLRVGLDDLRYSVHVVLWESVNQQKVPSGMYLDHIDGNRQNNHISNLRLVSQSENMKNSYANGHRGQVGVKQYSLEGEYIASYASIREAAQAVSVLEAGLRDATVRHGTCGGFYWLRENDPQTIEEVLTSWIPEGFTVLKDYPTYCINAQGQVYGKRNKKIAQVHYSSNRQPWVSIEGKRVRLKNIMP